LAEQGMALDLMGELTHMGTEAEAIEQILNLCTVLFAPRQVIYTSINNNRAEHVYASPSSPPPKTGDIETWLTRDSDAASWLETEGGFCLGLTHQKQPLGLLEIKEVAFPKYQRDYLNMAVLIARVCGLAIAKTRLFQEFRQLATTDPLTGLHNRRHFFSLASNEFSRTCRYNRPLAALMLDIDHFKKVNDSFGHAAGDRVLSEVAQCCREALRSTDINGRYGGEEFVFLLPETDQDAAQAFAERLRRTIADLPIALEGHALHITASLGLASQTNDCPSLEALLDRSDQALYAAKRSGRNRVCTWPDQIRAQKDSP
jgi:diguanylate cyclase (GGDEF)-like protein